MCRVFLIAVAILEVVQAVSYPVKFFKDQDYPNAATIEDCLGEESYVGKGILLKLTVLPGQNKETLSKQIQDLKSWVDNPKKETASPGPSVNNPNFGATVAIKILYEWYVLNPNDLRVTVGKGSNFNPLQSSKGSEDEVGSIQYHSRWNVNFDKITYPVKLIENKNLYPTASFFEQEPGYDCLGMEVVGWKGFTIRLTSTTINPKLEDPKQIKNKFETLSANKDIFRVAVLIDGKWYKLNPDGMQPSAKNVHLNKYFAVHYKSRQLWNGPTYPVKFVYIPHGEDITEEIIVNCKDEYVGEEILGENGMEMKCTPPLLAGQRNEAIFPKIDRLKGLLMNVEQKPFKKGEDGFIMAVEFPNGWFLLDLPMEEKKSRSGSGFFSPRGNKNSNGSGPVYFLTIKYHARYIWNNKKYPVVFVEDSDNVPTKYDFHSITTEYEGMELIDRNGFEIRITKTTGLENSAKDALKEKFQKFKASPKPSIAVKMSDSWQMLDSSNIKLGTIENDYLSIHYNARYAWKADANLVNFYNNMLSRIPRSLSEKDCYGVEYKTRTGWKMQLVVDRNIRSYATITSIKNALSKTLQNKEHAVLGIKTPTEWQILYPQDIRLSEFNEVFPEDNQEIWIYYDKITFWSSLALKHPVKFIPVGPGGKLEDSHFADDLTECVGEESIGATGKFELKLTPVLHKQDSDLDYDDFQDRVSHIQEQLLQAFYNKVACGILIAVKISGLWHILDPQSVNLSENQDKKAGLKYFPSNVQNRLILVESTTIQYNFKWVWNIKQSPVKFVSDMDQFPNHKFFEDAYEYDGMETADVNGFRIVLRPRKDGQPLNEATIRDTVQQISVENKSRIAVQFLDNWYMLNPKDIKFSVDLCKNLCIHYKSRWLWDGPMLPVKFLSLSSKDTQNVENITNTYCQGEEVIEQNGNLELKLTLAWEGAETFENYKIRFAEFTKRVESVLANATTGEAGENTIIVKFISDWYELDLSTIKVGNVQEKTEPQKKPRRHKQRKSKDSESEASDSSDTESDSGSPPPSPRGEPLNPFAPKFVISVKYGARWNWQKESFPVAFINDYNKFPDQESLNKIDPDCFGLEGVENNGFLIKLKTKKVAPKQSVSETFKNLVKKFFREKNKDFRIAVKISNVWQMLDPETLKEDDREGEYICVHYKSRSVWKASEVTLKFYDEDSPSCKGIEVMTKSGFQLKWLWENGEGPIASPETLKSRIHSILMSQRKIELKSSNVSYTLNRNNIMLTPGNEVLPQEYDETGEVFIYYDKKYVWSMGVQPAYEVILSEGPLQFPNLDKHVASIPFCTDFNRPQIQIPEVNSGSVEQFIRMCKKANSTVGLNDGGVFWSALVKPTIHWADKQIILQDFEFGAKFYYVQYQVKLLEIDDVNPDEGDSFSAVGIVKREKKDQQERESVELHLKTSEKLEAEFKNYKLVLAKVMEHGKVASWKKISKPEIDQGNFIIRYGETERYSWGKKQYKVKFLKPWETPTRPDDPNMDVIGNEYPDPQDTSKRIMVLDGETNKVNGQGMMAKQMEAYFKGHYRLFIVVRSDDKEPWKVIHPFKIIEIQEGQRQLTIEYREKNKYTFYLPEIAYLNNPALPNMTQMTVYIGMESIARVSKDDPKSVIFRPFVLKHLSYLCTRVKLIIMHKNQPDATIVLEHLVKEGIQDVEYQNGDAASIAEICPDPDHSFFISNNDHDFHQGRTMFMETSLLNDEFKNVWLSFRKYLGYKPTKENEHLPLPYIVNMGGDDLRKIESTIYFGRNFNEIGDLSNDKGILYFGLGKNLPEQMQGEIMHEFCNIVDGLFHCVHISDDLDDSSSASALDRQHLALFKKTLHATDFVNLSDDPNEICVIKDIGTFTGNFVTVLLDKNPNVFIPHQLGILFSAGDSKELINARIVALRQLAKMIKYGAKGGFQALPTLENLNLYRQLERENLRKYVPASEKFETYKFKLIVYFDLDWTVIDGDDEKSKHTFPRFHLQHLTDPEETKVHSKRPGMVEMLTDLSKQIPLAIFTAGYHGKALMDHPDYKGLFVDAYTKHDISDGTKDSFFHEEYEYSLLIEDNPYGATARTKNTIRVSPFIADSWTEETVKANAIELQKLKADILEIYRRLQTETAPYSFYIDNDFKVNFNAPLVVV